MRVRPILFIPEMVRAILDGRKTVTRRVIKPQPQGYFEVSEKPLYIYDTDFNQGKIFSSYQPGDILYVRETWCKYGKLDRQDQVEDESEKYYYRADGENPTPYNDFLVQHPGWDEYRKVPVWRPSIHMPKAAARIWLKVTDVRVERLQDITEEQALKEGLLSEPLLEGGEALPVLWDFPKIWNCTIKKPDLCRYGWDANPWVWVIEFARCEKPEGGQAK